MISHRPEDRVPPLNESDRIIFDFSDPNHSLIWLPVNDVIMGGVSTGEMKQHTQQTARFSGTLSLDHGGGFSSVRTLPAEYNLSACAGLVLTVKGDGKSYKLNLTDGSSEAKILFQAKLNPPEGRWDILYIPFEDFMPTFRGRRVEQQTALNSRAIQTFGLMISERQAGEFSLEVAAIAARTSATNSTVNQ